MLRWLWANCDTGSLTRDVELIHIQLVKNSPFTEFLCVSNFLQRITLWAFPHSAAIALQLSSTFCTLTLFTANIVQLMCA